MPGVKVSLAGAQGWLLQLQGRGWGGRRDSNSICSAVSALPSLSVSINPSSGKPSLSVLGGEVAPRWDPACISAPNLSLEPLSRVREGLDQPSHSSELLGSRLSPFPQR